jgi:hypothetical protein
MKGAGRVGGRRGRETRQRARVRTRRSTVSAEKAELTELAHGAERRKGCAGQRLNDWQNGPARPREKVSAQAKETGADRSAPAGRARESARERKPPLTGGARLSGGAGAQPNWADLGCWDAFPFFLFLWIF